MANAMFATLPRFGGLASLLVTFVGFVVIVAGLAELQKQTNALPNIDPTNDLYQTYVTTFNSVQIQPYPTDHHFQFSFIWFIIFGQLFTLLLCAIVLAVPMFHTGRGAALTFLAILCTLAIGVVNNLTYLHKNADANPVAQSYKKKYINVTLAGALLVVIGNVLTILALGFWEPWRALIGHNNYYGTNKAAAPANTGVAAAETRV